MRLKKIWSSLPIVPGIALVSALAVGIAAACSTPAKQTAADVTLEPVSSTGANPFSPPMGTDQPNVTPPPDSGGSFPGDTVGLFGGTANESSCDPGKLIVFLQEHPDKGAAWAGVLGITQAEIPDFVHGLTPVILRSDTQVTNHGFDNGQVTVIPAILQAGTAVLVDKHGLPVTKCFCGNPLTAPASFTNVRFVGVSWPTFVSSSITIISSVTVVINNFTLVVPSTGDSFQRPAGTGGRADGAVTKAPPSSGPPPTTPTRPPTSGPASSSPASSGPATSGPATSGPATSGPTTSGPATSSALPSSPAQGAAPSPAVPSSGVSSSGVPSSPASSSSGAAPGSSAGDNRASSVVGDCYVASDSAHAVVLVRNDGTTQHTYTATVELGPVSGFNATQTVPVGAAPGQTGRATVTTGAPGTDDVKLPCSITSIRDEKGQVVSGGTLPPPPDTRPTPKPSTSAPSPSRTSVAPTTTSGPRTTQPPTTQGPRTTEPRTTSSAPRTTTAPRTSSGPRTTTQQNPVPEES